MGDEVVKAARRKEKRKPCGQKAKKEAEKQK